MPKYTIELPQKAVTKLQAVVARYNDTVGTSLTVKQWIERHLRELAIAEQLATAIDTVQKEQEQQARDDLQSAINTTRDQLVADLDTP